jgi:hypothetical protein
MIALKQIHKTGMPRLKGHGFTVSDALDARIYTVKKQKMCQTPPYTLLASQYLEAAKTVRILRYPYEPSSRAEALGAEHLSG